MVTIFCATAAFHLHTSLPASTPVFDSIIICFEIQLLVTPDLCDSVCLHTYSISYPLWCLSLRCQRIFHYHVVGDRVFLPFGLRCSALAALPFGLRCSALAACTHFSNLTTTAQILLLLFLWSNRGLMFLMVAVGSLSLLTVVVRSFFLFRRWRCSLPYSGLSDAYETTRE